VILRGARLAEQRVSLMPPHALRAVHSAETLVRNSLADPAAVVTPISETASIEPAEPVLSFENVVAWLAVQDERTRSACAAILATEVTEVHESAKADGYAVGMRNGQEAARESVLGATRALGKLIDAAETTYAQDRQDLQASCVDVVSTVLAKIAGPLLAAEKAVLGAVLEVLARVKDGRELTIRVARDDLSVLQRFETELSSALGGRKFEMIADGRVELGGCIVESKHGSLDGRLEVQMRELQETLRLAKLATREAP
jgi:flagellar biosynthesis/type III secretory pathway protein FliH